MIKPSMLLIVSALLCTLLAIRAKATEPHLTAAAKPVNTVHGPAITQR